MDYVLKYGERRVMQARSMTGSICLDTRSACHCDVSRCHPSSYPTGNMYSQATLTGITLVGSEAERSPSSVLSGCSVDVEEPVRAVDWRSHK